MVGKPHLFDLVGKIKTQQDESRCVKITRCPFFIGIVKPLFIPYSVGPFPRPSVSLEEGGCCALMGKAVGDLCHRARCHGGS